MTRSRRTRSTPSAPPSAEASATAVEATPDDAFDSSDLEETSSPSEDGALETSPALGDETAPFEEKASEEEPSEKLEEPSEKLEEETPVDPRLATVEHPPTIVVETSDTEIIFGREWTPMLSIEAPSVVDTSIPDPRLATVEPVKPIEPLSSEPAPPTLEELQAKVQEANEARDRAVSVTTKLQTRLAAANEQLEAVQRQLAEAQSSTTADALSQAQATLLETSMQLLDEQHKRADAEKGRDAALTELEDLAGRFIFMVIPKHSSGQANDTRLYVLASNVVDAIQRLEKRGLITADNVANITQTSQQIVL